MGGGVGLRRSGRSVRGARGVKGSTLSNLLDAREQGEAVVLATDLETGREQLIRPFQIPEGDGDPLVRAAR